MFKHRKKNFKGFPKLEKRIIDRIIILEDNNIYNNIIKHTYTFSRII